MSRWRSTAFIFTAVTMLTGLIAMTAHTSVWAPARDGVARLSEVVGAVGIVVVAGLVLTSLAATVLRRRGDSSDTTPSRLRHTLLPAAIGGVAAMSLFQISSLELHPYQAFANASAPDEQPGRIGTRLYIDWGGDAVRRPGEEETGGATTRYVPRTWIAATVAALALLGLGGAWLAARRRSKSALIVSPEEVAKAERVAAHNAIVQAIDGMLADSDPRTAIIGAYAQLLEELAASGAPRHDYEGPKEHLRRILANLHVRPAPMQRLIGLFEVARFSTRTVTDADRDEALLALETIADELVEPDPGLVTSTVHSA